MADLLKLSGKDVDDALLLGLILVDEVFPAARARGQSPDGR